MKLKQLLHRILMMLLITIFTFSSAICESPYAVSYTTYDTTYEAIIKMYINVINRKDTGRHDLFNQLVYSIYEMDPSQKESINFLKKYLGYLITDINGDGQNEMIIGQPDNIFEVFTVENNKVRELINAGARYRCALLDNGYFYRTGSSGAAYTNCELWKMNGTGEVSFVEGYHTLLTGYDINIPGMEPGVLVWLHDIGNRNSKDNPVTEDEAEAWISQQESHIIHKKAIPLAVYEQYSDRIESADKIGVLTINGKASGAQTINIRSKPSKTSKIKHKSRVGTYVLILGQEDGYYHVVVGEKEGYIQQDFVSTLDEAPAVEFPKSGKSKSTKNPSNKKQSNTPTPQPTIVPDYNAPTSAPALYKGAQGQIIKDMQSRLAGLGYYTGEINGIFNEKTEEALLKFMEYNNIVGDVALNENTSKILYSVMAKPYSESTPTPEPVIDHYEEHEVQRSRRVMDHIETYYTYEDDGNGHMIETPHERPVYRTEYYTETILEPVYKPQ